MFYCFMFISIKRSIKIKCFFLLQKMSDLNEERFDEQESKEFEDYKHRNQQKHDKKNKQQSQQKKETKDKEKKYPKKNKPFWC